MVENDLQTRIETEIVRALDNLKAPPGWQAPAMLRVPYRQRWTAWGAPIEFLAIVGSYGDTMTDPEVLEALEAYSRGEAIIDVDLDARA